MTAASRHDPSTGKSPRLSRGRRLVLALPWLWMTVFILLPLLIVVRISLAEALLAVPPYSELVDRVQGTFRLNLGLENYAFLLTDRLYPSAYINSLKIALVSTAICLIIGYPMAWAITRSAPGTRSILLLLIVVPAWTSFLIRIYAWMGILANKGFINSALLALGLVDEPIALLRTDFAVYVGIVYAYLPFMILPLYAAMLRVDPAFIEAAADLGAGPWRCFREVLLPLTRGGVIAGSLLVFIPATGEFVVPELLGGADTLMIGKVLWQEFFNNRDWPMAAALAVLLVALLLVPMLAFQKYQLTGDAVLQDQPREPQNAGSRRLLLARRKRLMRTGR